MAGTALVVSSERWWGWQELPVRRPGWGASPILVTDVQPLKTGKGVLRIAFIHAVCPVAAVRRCVDLRILHRAATHLVGTLQDEGGTIRTGILAAADLDWLQSMCTPLWQRRPPQHPTILIDGKPAARLTADEYLAATLGATPDAGLRGATAESFGGPRPPMPDRHATFAVGATLDPFDSWLAARGVVPAEMEDKWFIYQEEGRLLFRRSWTGNLIWAVDAQWRGDTLHLGQATANRDPSQYTETSVDRDRAMLLYVLRTVLLNLRAPFPADSGVPSGEAAVQAWAAAGKASL